MPKAAKKNSTTSLRKTSPAGAPARPITDPIFPNPSAFILPAGILQRDSSIIDEQADHLVVMLRIPKDVIRNNAPLLRALMEIAAADDDARPEVAEETA
jgi:hypothetical protein